MIHGWYFGMLELQPLDLLVTASNSRYAASSAIVVERHEAEDRALAYLRCSRFICSSLL